mmetsp:Transcript_78198/g.154996  ORF Transcript_78198/g.154996 Transcript_78198/m.154996 type:complete len:296 (+) Transcript_78198:242-1129(+)
MADEFQPLHGCQIRVPWLVDVRDHAFWINCLPQPIVADDSIIIPLRRLPQICCCWVPVENCPGMIVVHPTKRLNTEAQECCPVSRLSEGQVSHLTAVPHSVEPCQRCTDNTPIRLRAPVGPRDFSVHALCKKGRHLRSHTAQGHFQRSLCQVVEAPLFTKERTLVLEPDTKFLRRASASFAQVGHFNAIYIVDLLHHAEAYLSQRLFPNMGLGLKGPSKFQLQIERILNNWVGQRLHIRILLFHLDIHLCGSVLIHLDIHVCVSVLLHPGIHMRGLPRFLHLDIWVAEAADQIQA